MPSSDDEQIALADSGVAESPTVAGDTVCRVALAAITTRVHAGALFEVQRSRFTCPIFFSDHR